MAFKVIFNSLRYLNINKNAINCINQSPQVSLVSKYYSKPFRIGTRSFSDGSGTAAGPKKPRAKTVEEEKIVLIENDKNYITTTMEHAKKLVKAKSMALVSAKKSISGLKTFNLVPMSKVLEDEEKKSNDAKSNQTKHKSIVISSKITDHDLETKIKNIQKVLGKQITVNVLIQKDKTEKEMRTIRSKIENAVKDSGMIDKKFGPNNPRFYIVPLKLEEKTTQEKTPKGGTELEE